MTTDLDTLLTALYVELDDHVVPPRPCRPGYQRRLTDAELLTLAVAQVLLGARSEHHWLRLAYARLGHLFRYLPKQPGYDKRLRAARPLLQAAIAHLASRSPSWWDDLWLADSTPVPCAASRQTVRRSDLVGWANYGYCASHSGYVWGLRLYLVTAADGMPIAWALATPKLGERDVLTGMLSACDQPRRPGQILLVDKGFAGRMFAATTTAAGLRLIRPDRRDEPTRTGDLGKVRQWIESVNDTLKGQLGLEQHGGRTYLGVTVRVAQRLLALAAGIWHNWLTDAPAKRSLTAYNH